MDLSQGFTLHLCNILYDHFAQARRSLKKPTKELFAKRLRKQDMHKVIV